MRGNRKLGAMMEAYYADMLTTYMELLAEEDAEGTEDGVTEFMVLREQVTSGEISRETFARLLQLDTTGQEDTGMTVVGVHEYLKHFTRLGVYKAHLEQNRDLYTQEELIEEYFLLGVLYGAFDERVTLEDAFGAVCVGVELRHTHICALARIEGMLDIAERVGDR